jgi:hypothetical protein
VVEVIDPIEEGYRHLANDPEFARPNRGKHHCGFDFELDKMTAVCKCGAIATNPLWTIKGEKK